MFANIVKETLYDMWHLKLENWKIGIEKHY